jgi:hypothetical protein
VFDDAFSNFESQVEPAKRRITQLKILHDSESVKIVIEKIAVLTHSGIQRFFTSMAERRVPDIVNQSERLDQVHIQSELSSDRARDLRYFERMGEAITKMIGVTASEDLGF